MGETAEKSAFSRDKTSITHQQLKGFSALNVPLGGGRAMLADCR